MRISSELDAPARPQPPDLLPSTISATGTDDGPSASPDPEVAEVSAEAAADASTAPAAPASTAPAPATDFVFSVPTTPGSTAALGQLVLPEPATRRPKTRRKGVIAMVQRMRRAVSRWKRQHGSVDVDRLDRSRESVQLDLYRLTSFH